MNHQKVYDTIIQKAKYENRVKIRKNNPNYVYFENHHILPKCIGGGDEKENKILLTAKEHFVCHKLLTYIYKGNRAIVYAFHRMTYSKNGNHIKSSRDYKYAIELIKTTPLSDETKKKLNHVGEKNPMYGKHHRKESIDKMKAQRAKQIEPMKGKHHTKMTKKKMRNARLGKIPWNKGNKNNYRGKILSNNSITG